MAAEFDRHCMPSPVYNADVWPLDPETGIRVGSKVGNLPSKFGHARPLGIIRHVCDRRTKATLIAPFLTGGDITKYWQLYKSLICYVRISLLARHAMLANVDPSSVSCPSRCPSRGCISNTKQDRPIVTMKHHIEMAQQIFLRHSNPSPEAALGR